MCGKPLRPQNYGFSLHSVIHIHIHNLYFVISFRWIGHVRITKNNRIANELNTERDHAACGICNISFFHLFVSSVQSSPVYQRFFRVFFLLLSFFFFKCSCSSAQPWRLPFQFKMNACVSLFTLIYHSLILFRILCIFFFPFECAGHTYTK